MNRVQNHQRPLAKYEALVAQGILTHDAAQYSAAEKLDALHHALAQSPPPYVAWLPQWLLRAFNAQPPPPPRGLYIYGGVGCGKSMLMDLFFDGAPMTAKRRTHFHPFMQEIHERIYAYRQMAKSSAKQDNKQSRNPPARDKSARYKQHDPIPSIAAELAKQTRLLCFDEFQVKDIADASILGRLFAALFALGVVVVATSNHAPDALYAGGLNRHRFLPFIALLKEHMDVLHLQAAKDYRLARLMGYPVWFYPLDRTAQQNMDESFTRLTGAAPVQAAQLTIKARTLLVPAQAQGVARFAFADLCAANLGAGDYLALAEKYHTLLVDYIPCFDADKRNEGLRFVHLIDTLYAYKVKLVASAAVPAAALFAENASVDGSQRALSRLAEMQSKDYLATAHGT